ncbi:MAG: type II toxin-antitoxin system MqsA family antitoxin [Acidobacteria bacterium]|nr:type II toxin-antitoxin system MqsA family antitoxin [Acidobacteriota bacterium]
MKYSSSESSCPLCGGRKEAGRTTYTVDLSFGVVVVRNVPAMRCTQCGEEWIDNATAAELERITNEAKAKGREIEVVAL